MRTTTVIRPEGRVVGALCQVIDFSLQLFAVCDNRGIAKKLKSVVSLSLSRSLLILLSIVALET